MGFSTSQYPSAEEMAREQAGKALSATIRTEKLLAELVEEQNQKVSISELRRILPVALELTDEQHDKLRRLYPMTTNKSSEETIANTGALPKRRQDENGLYGLYGYMGLDIDEDIKEIFKEAARRSDK